MKALIQRVNSAAVRVDGQVVGSISKGLLILLGVKNTDTGEMVAPLAKKVSELRLFPADGKDFHISVMDAQGGVLVVSQFTLYADPWQGRRPDFNDAMKGELAKPLVDQFIAELKKLGIKQVESGIFGADMKVSLENDGPVTISVDYPS